jgi:hypothetical protein
LDADAATTVGDSATSDAPSDDYCYTKCLQSYSCSYDASTSYCTRGDDFQKCCDNCKNPVTTTPNCEQKTPCDCLINGCNWCQVKGYATDGTTTTSFVWGYCASTGSESNTCTADKTMDGSGGSLISTTPTECVNDVSVDPTIKDSSSAITDPVAREAIKKINTGEVDESKLQQEVVSLCDGCITIVRMLSADATADNIGTVRTIVNADCPTKTNTEICNCISKAYAKTCNIPEEYFKSCDIKAYTETDTGSAKRNLAQAQDTYLHTGTVDPSGSSNPSSAGILAPVWMMLFAIFLFFRM